MLSHLRAGLYLLLVSVVLCCGVYPFVLWCIGMGLFAHAAHGSLIDGKGQPTNDPAAAVGSRLIGQPFSDDRYFWPRPSAAGSGYNASASSGSNWGSNNPLLRGRVAQLLGPVVKYGDHEEKAGQLVSPDVVRWFLDEDERAQGKKESGLVARWAETYPALAQAWVKQDDAHKAYVKAWADGRKKDVEAWIKENPNAAHENPEDLAVPFFQSFSRFYPGQWLEVTGAKKIEAVEPDEKDRDVPAYFFDLWRQAHPNVELKDVPGDYVFASGSGLDPHITLDNALFQLYLPGRVADKWAELAHRPVKDVRDEIENLLRQKAESPLHGLAGVPLINVLEVNLILRNTYEPPSGRPSEK